jgi:hypothetical protein
MCVSKSVKSPISLKKSFSTKEDVFRIRDELQAASKASQINERRFKGILLNTSFVESYVKHKIASPGNSSDFVFQPPTKREAWKREYPYWTGGNCICAA